MNGILVYVRALGVLGLLCSGLGAQNVVEGSQKLSEVAGGFGGDLDNDDLFGSSLTSLGDLDGDGVKDAAVGALSQDPGSGGGAVWILFLRSDGTVRTQVKIGEDSGGFAGDLRGGDRFGSALALLGDLDGDGVPELAVGASGDDTGGLARGAVYVLFLRTDGTVRTHTKIASGSGGFGGALDNGDSFGAGLAALVPSVEGAPVRLAVGTPGDDAGPGFDGGAVWMLRVGPSGTVVGETRITSGLGGFTGDLASSDRFGAALGAPGDVNGDTVLDLAVGAPGDDGEGTDRGAVWILFLRSDDTVAAAAEVPGDPEGASLTLADFGRFGSSVGGVGDLDGDQVGELVAGAPLAPGGGLQRGELWLLFLRADGGVREALRIVGGAHGFSGAIGDRDRFGEAAGVLGDLDGDEAVELAVGAVGDDDGGPDRGAVWVLFLRAAIQTVNPGSGTNPQVYQPGTAPPRVGSVWRPTVVTDTLRGDPLFHFMGASERRMDTLRPRRRASGEVLISFAPRDLVAFLTSRPGESFELPVPNDPSLVGMELFTQGGWVVSGDGNYGTPAVPLGGEGPSLENRLRGSLVNFANGIDVVLGF